MISVWNKNPFYFTVLLATLGMFCGLAHPLYGRGFEIAGWPRPERPAGKIRSLEKKRMEALVRTRASERGADPDLIAAIVKVESNFNPLACSSAKAKGLMQLIDETAEFMKVGDVYNPDENVAGGIDFARYLASEFQGNLVKTLAAYHAGRERVKRHGGVPPIRETRQYVRQVLLQYYLYKKQHGGDAGK